MPATRRRHVLTVSLLALAACGGGGGGAGPAPSLAVQEDAPSATVGGSAVALHAVLTGTDGVPAWTLTGPGTLSATTGLTVSYVPPDPGTFDADAPVSITASLGSLSGKAQIALKATDAVGNHWDISRERSIGWNAVAWANGAFVAVGEDGGMAHSVDGQTWTLLDTQDGEDWVGVSYGNSSWVAVAQGGQVATSSDGATWTRGAPLFVSGAPGDTAMSQVAFGGGRFVAVGEGGAWQSADGLAWSPADHGADGVAYGNGVFVGAEPDGLFVSSDGAHWTQTLVVDPSVGLRLKSVAFGGGRFVASDFHDRTYTSTDGRQWTQQPVTFQGTGWRLDYADGAFWTGGGGILFDSTDAGASWAQLAQVDASGLTRFAASPQAFVFASGTGILASGADAASAVARTQARPGTLEAIDFADGRILVGGDGGLITATPGQSPWPAIAWMREGLHVVVPQSFAHDPNGVVLAVGYCYDMAGSVVHVVARSTDGVNWTQVPLGAEFHGVLHVTYDGKRFVVTDYPGHVFASTDGSAWTQLASAPVPDGLNALAIASGGGHLVIVGEAGFAASSTDGAQWTAAPMVTMNGAPFNLNAVAWDGRAFVAVGEGGLVATSTDGLSWQVAPSATSETLYAILVAGNGRYLSAGAHGALQTSADGVHWTARGTRASQTLFGLAQVGSSFYAVGQDGLIEVSTH